jgi:hypothetical protein
MGERFTGRSDREATDEPGAECAGTSVQMALAALVRLMASLEITSMDDRSAETGMMWPP